MKKNKCLLCGSVISNQATHCRSCWQKGKNNSMYGKKPWNYDGSKNYCCMDCGDLISKPTALKGNGRCRTCSRTGKLSWNKKTAKLYNGKSHHSWKGGLPKCVDCGKELSFYTCTRCVVCDRKFRWKNNDYIRKQLPKKSLNIRYNQINMRSSWEYIFAYWLDLSGVKWEYECKTFDLGDTIYIPDFYLPEFDCWIEIKGWWREKSIKKFKKFKKVYPDINIYVFQLKEFDEILGLNKRQLNKLYKSVRKLNGRIK